MNLISTRDITNHGADTARLICVSSARVIAPPAAQTPSEKSGNFLIQVCTVPIWILRSMDLCYHSKMKMIHGREKGFELFTIAT